MQLGQQADIPQWKAQRKTPLFHVKKITHFREDNQRPVHGLMEMMQEGDVKNERWKIYTSKSKFL